MIIKSSTKDYLVSLYNSFDNIKNYEVGENTFVVIDKVLYELYKKELFLKIPENQLYILEAVEDNKKVETALEICEIMTNIPAKRNVRLVSFGGGIVQDYLRS